MWLEFMFKAIKSFFKAIGLATSALEKESEKLLIQSTQNLNDYIESQGGIEKVEKTKREMLEYLKKNK